MIPCLRRYNGTPIHFGPAQMETILMIAQGMTSADIAEIRNIEVATVNSTRSEIRKKIGLTEDHSGKDLLRWMHWNGLTNWTDEGRSDAGLHTEETYPSPAGPGDGDEGDGAVYPGSEPGRPDSAAWGIPASGDGRHRSKPSEGAAAEEYRAEGAPAAGHGGNLEVYSMQTGDPRQAYPRPRQGREVGNGGRGENSSRRSGGTCMSEVRRPGSEDERSVPQQAGVITTQWKCKVCGKQDTFKHYGMEGAELIDEIRARHTIASPKCKFWDSKMTIKRISVS